MLSDLNEIFRVDSDQAINTKSNLNVDVLNDILSLIGIEPDAYLAKRPIINQRLVESRNAIAHGGRPSTNLSLPGAVPLNLTTSPGYATMTRRKCCADICRLDGSKCRISATMAASTATKCALGVPSPTITATSRSVWQQNPPPLSPAVAGPADVTPKHRTVQLP